MPRLVCCGISCMTILSFKERGIKMKRFFAIVLSLLILLTLCVSVSAAENNKVLLGDKTVIKLNGWAYEKVNSYGYEIDEYYGDSTEPSVPWSFAKQYVTSIGAHAFNGNTSVTSVKTTGALESIGDYAFNGCTSLKTVTLYDALTLLGVGSFYGDKALNNINVVDTSVSDIPAYCFAECGIVSMTLPETCESIGNCAFYNCSKLTKVKIPDSVTSIADTAFTDCDNLLIVCSPNSYAAQYAQANHIDYISSEDFVMGDVDGNGSVSLRDATLIQLFNVELSELDDMALLRSDINGDGKVNLRDATLIQMYRVELIDSLEIV